MSAAKQAFVAWVNHPDPAMIDAAWEKCDTHTQAAWERVGASFAAPNTTIADLTAALANATEYAAKADQRIERLLTTLEILAKNHKLMCMVRIGMSSDDVNAMLIHGDVREIIAAERGTEPCDITSGQPMPVGRTMADA